MRVTKRLGYLLLGIWLVLTGLGEFVAALHGLGLLLAVVAIAAGVLILIER